MKSIKEIIDDPTPYTGSEATRDMVRRQIAERWGEKEATKYDPTKNARTFKSWLRLGYRVKRGEKSLRSTTFVEEKDGEGAVVRTFPRTVSLFYYLQVEKA